jgi:hypothetical protein
MKLPRLFLTVVFALVISVTWAQQVLIRAELDTNRALIGDQIKLRLTVEKPAAIKVGFPVFKDTLAHDVEIISISSVDTASITSDTIVLKQDLMISVFDTGLFEIPSLAFTMLSNGKQDTLNTLPVYFEILPVIADSTIRDIKAIYKVPVSFRELSPYILLAIVIGLLTWLLIHYLRNRKTKDKLMPIRNASEPPDIIALRELEQLKEEKPWMYNKIKYYHIRVSEILRIYIEHRFRIAALEQTTGEILASLKPAVCKASDIDHLSSVLKLADLVKFAKVIPGVDENANQITVAMEFVRNTIIHEVADTPDDDKENTIVQSNRLS